MARVGNRGNEYAYAVENMDAIPKTVLAAIAFSMCFIAVEEQGGKAANDRLYEEWNALYQAGIVPQKPIARKGAK